MSALPHRSTAAAADVASRPRLGGASGNETLTLTMAVVLTFLLLAEGVTLLNVGGLLTPHLFLGLVLVPPLLVKLASTGYRMVRYYTGAPVYREKGPPAVPLRLLAPVLVAATVGIFASGIAMLVLGHVSGILMLLHKASFIVWSVVFGIHFLSYLPRLVRSLSAAERRSRPRAGGQLRAMIAASSVGAGVALALLLLPLVTALHGGDGG